MGRRLLALSGSDLWQTNRQLTYWRKLFKLDVRAPESALRPYPAVTSAHAIGSRLLLSSARYGLVEIDGETLAVRERALEAQLPIPAVSIIATVSDLALPTYGSRYILRGANWNEASDSDWWKAAAEADRPLGNFGGTDIVFRRSRSGANLVGWREPAMLLVDLPVLFEGRYYGIYDAVPLGPDAILVATIAGLLRYVPSTGRTERVKLAGLNGFITRLARDHAGRIWLGGKGLFLMTAMDRVVAVHPALPFRDSRVFSMHSFGHRLAIALGKRGLILIDPDQVATVAGRWALPHG